MELIIKLDPMCVSLPTAFKNFIEDAQTEFRREYLDKEIRKGDDFKYMVEDTHVQVQIKSF
jgi:hypothetical protein